MKKITIAFLVFIVFTGISYSQGPMPAYFYNDGASLSWAECFIYMNGGSKLELKFLPVVETNFHRAPLGTGKYSKDIDVDACIVFAGNGISTGNIYNCYLGRRSDYSQGEIDVEGKVVMFCYDYPDFTENFTVSISNPNVFKGRFLFDTGSSSILSANRLVSGAVRKTSPPLFSRRKRADMLVRGVLRMSHLYYCLPAERAPPCNKNRGPRRRSYSS